MIKIFLPITALACASLTPLPAQTLSPVQPAQSPITQIQQAAENRNEPTGTIFGTIFDPAGKPLADADLFVIGTSPTSTFKVRVRADGAGHYKVDQLKLGKYVVRPYKLDKGYQLGANTFSEDSPSRVLLDSLHPVVEKDITVSPPAGTLQGEIRDAKTHELIPGADVMICRTADPERAGQITGEQSTSFKQKVPVGVAISISAQKPGYYPVLIRDIKVDSLQVKTIDLLMAPAPAGQTIPPLDGHCHFSWQP